jgi:hypothetical protein
MTIGDQTFDLRRGAFFLVDTSSGEIRVRQVARTLPALPSQEAPSDVFLTVFQELALKDAEIRGFYREPPADGAEGGLPQDGERADEGQ